MKYLILLIFSIYCHTTANGQIITTIAGGGTSGIGDGGPAVDCELDGPIGIFFDGSGNIYLGDRNNNRIRKIRTDGTIVTIAGTGDAGSAGDGGPATDASVYAPYGLCVDGSGNVYCADGHERTRKISAGGIITTIAGGGTSGLGDGGPATNAMVSASDVKIDAANNIIICDGANNRIRKIDASGIITTIAGGGLDMSDGIPATDAALHTPYCIYIDGAGNIYVGETYQSRVRKIAPSGIITTIAGTGESGYNGDNIAATTAKLNRVYGIGMDGSGNLYIGEAGNHRVRKVNSAGIITTLAGTGVVGFFGDGGPATAAKFSTPAGVAIGPDGNLYVNDFSNNRVRMISNPGSSTMIPITDKGFAFFPNPCSGNFFIDASSIYGEECRIVMTDLTGKEIYNNNCVAHKDMMVSVQAPEGIYLLHITTAGGTSTHKVFIERS